MKYFINIKSLEDLKKEYKKLAKKYHPDLNRDKDTTDTMKQINIEYNTLFEQLKTDKNKSENATTYTNIIDELIKHDIIIDIVGSWIWVHGENTYNIKDQLKSLNFRWSKAKKKWYYSETLDKKKKKGTMSYNQIINKYGRETIKGNKQEYILLD